MGGYRHGLLPSIAQASLALGLWAVLLLAAPAASAQRLLLPVKGSFGGTLAVPMASDPQTLNPVFVTDSASQLLASLTMADLMHINPRTLRVEPALATSVVHKSDRVWIVHLRHGVRFSDGQPFTATDVAFSFAVYTDAKLDPPERELLSVGKLPLRCKVLAPDKVELDLPGPMAVGDRLLDSVWMLPAHLLEPAYRAGRLASAWGVGTPAAAVAGLGAFRLAALQPGQQVQLVRNPYYWRADAQGRALPFLDRLRLPVVTDPNLRLTMFARGQVDGLQSVNSADFARLSGNPCCRLLDAGPGLNSEALVFNLAPQAGPPAPPRGWFHLTGFRQAVSLAVDRANLVRNVYGGQAAALASLTSPSNGFWDDPVPATAVNLAAARARLAAAGFHLRQGRLYDPAGHPVAFSLIVPSTNQARMKIAVFIQEDLRRVGMAVQVVPLDFATYLDRFTHRDDFEAALVGIQINDADPNEESNVWPLDAPWHFWNPHPRQPAPWAVTLDRWFRLQLTSTDPAARLRDYRHIQAIEHQELPLIPLVSPDILAGVSPGLRGAAAALLPPHLLWNADQLYWPRPADHAPAPPRP